ncbi:MAG: hypothetical protein M3N91_16090 [Pseudomonadota bacterium]|nr:hypothetical protein [Pseudomonadota bacterium]
MNARISILLVLLLSTAGAKAWADDGCVDFKWEVTSERALFASSAAALPAGRDPQSAPTVLLNRLYELKLMPQDQVTFAATPGKKTPSAGANAGIVTFKLPASGSYRVAIDMPFWIDVVSNGALVVAKDFQGQHGCSSPHKIVEFELVGTRPFFLQLSSAAPDSVRLTITATPARKL